ncbi:MAG: DsbE family thiol:disulfide interchange protein, partial [Devosia sp.]|nr:DsbE family thiol:disulfide interchange protein [Devosia sp.]
MGARRIIAIAVAIAMLGAGLWWWMGERNAQAMLALFASWCGPCRDEHPLLLELAGRGDLVLAGINVTDLPENATGFLAELGNPYRLAGADTDKSVANRLG